MADQHKENLRKLLDFLEAEIIHKPENRWFVDELYNRLPNNVSPNETEQTLNDIKEQCIEEILKSQAEDFYKDFPISELKPQLIRDFIKMEMWRRRDNLGEFCLALYQQIEGMVNCLASKSEINNLVSALITAPAYINSESKKVNDRNANSTYQIANLLYFKDVASKSKTLVMSLLAVDKFRTIYYFICKQGRLLSTQYEEFYAETDILREIYSMRNQNHRGNSLADWEAQIDNKVRSTTTLHYFKYLDFLATFVEGVIKGYPIPEDLKKYAKSFTPVSVVVKGPTVVGKMDLPDDGRRRFK